MKFLLLIILFFAALFIFIPSIIVGIIRFLLTTLGGGSTSTYRSRHRDGDVHNGNDSGFSTSQQRNDARDGGRKKVFDDNEGEYVNFEEIKKPSEDK